MSEKINHFPVASSREINLILYTRGQTAHAVIHLLRPFKDSILEADSKSVKNVHDLEGLKGLWQILSHCRSCPILISTDFVAFYSVHRFLPTNLDMG